MRNELLNYICCPVCRGSQFEVTGQVEDTREYREGYIRCQSCGRVYSFTRGILDLMPNPNQVIAAEQAGWVELLGETSDALIDTMLKLPYLDDGPWITTYHNWDEIMGAFSVAGKAVLDIGAGRCWSTRRMMLAGARFALALDILRERFIGLETADIYFEHDGIYFERLIGDMNELPLQPGVFDVVFMTGTLHHSSDPGRAMQQVAKALATGGTAVIINEPVRSVFAPKSMAGCMEIEHGINENVYTIMEYMRATEQAGLRPQLFMPASLTHAFDHDPQRIAQELGPLGNQVIPRLWKHGLGRGLLRSPLLRHFYLIASMPLVMLAKKG